VRYVCFCGKVVPGQDSDALIASRELRGGNTAARYERYVRNAPFDSTTTQVRGDCPKCGLDYLTFLRLGDEFVVFTCKCGYNSIDDGAPPEVEV
jgi:hypothetical protein